MSTKRLLRGGSLALGTLLLPPVAWAGPMSVYYLTAGDQGTNWAVQGTGVVNTWSQQHPGNLGEYAVAVGNSVRTLGNGNCNGVGCGLGAEYSLGGVYTGVDYPYPVNPGSFYDGASDGTYNYSVDYRQTGTVYQFDADWANPVPLFSLGSDGFLGITYDASDNTLWLSQFDGSMVEHRSLSGMLLGSFAAGHSALSSLALDPADGTLWMGSQTTLGTFYQYSKGGLFLGSETYAALVGQNTLGGEFAVRGVPEPSTLGLLALGFMALCVRRRLRHE